jgi:hypothetical protein
MMRAVGSIVLANAGLLAWASCFGVLYAGVSLGCAAELHLNLWLGRFNALNALLLLATAVHIAPLLWFLWYLRRHSIAPPEGPPRMQTFISRLAVATSAIGVFAMLWIGVPLAFAPSCAMG